ncbi:MAG TPA: hypothetical protein VGG23_07195 [Acidimicrobiales bacterium]|jgi:hypothetical protein
MGDGRSARRITVLSSTWDGRDERAFVVRSLAGAASRVVDVDVLVPGPVGPPRADGLFDLVPIGVPEAGEIWPAIDAAMWPTTPTPDVVLFDGADGGAITLTKRFAPWATTLAVDDGRPAPTGIDQLLSVAAAPAPDGRSTPVHPIGLHVPVHPLAAQRRHNGFGFTGYVLVLSDRGPTGEDHDTPSPLAAWLIAALPRHDVVVVEDGVASAWRSRSLRGRIVIDTRTDLWRLVAHAVVTVDLGPGQLLARECVESLRYGIPVVVPATTAAAELAVQGGGLWYRNAAELLACVDAVNDRKLQNTLGEQGRRFADEWYGDPDRLVERVGTVLDAVLENGQR